MSLKYMPIFRVRQEEIKVLKSFDFQDRIYPCIEIIKAVDRVTPIYKKGSKTKIVSKKTKTFDQVYLPLIENIDSKKVFVDLPIHLRRSRDMKPETTKFLIMISDRGVRTSLMKSLSPLAQKIIPVISTYSGISGERGSITLQANDLRPLFPVLSFRTFMRSFIQDFAQIEKLVKKDDYVIMDWEDVELDLDDPDQDEIVDRLKELKCNIVIHRNAFPKSITNVGLDHGRKVKSIDNSLLEKYTDFAGSSFSDYVGIKKDDITKGGTISPGFVYYDAVNNEYYGFRFLHGGLKKGETPPELQEFITTIVPAVISCAASKRMRSNSLGYLSPGNKGWTMINDINAGTEPGRSPAKFKRISMEHYIYCIRQRINNEDFG